MKQIYIRPTTMLPIVVIENGVIVNKGVEAIVHGKSKVVWNPEADHPKVWIEVEDSIEIEIRSSNG